LISEYFYEIIDLVFGALKPKMQQRGGELLRKEINKKLFAEIVGTGSFLPPNKYSTEDMKKYFPQINLEENLKSIGVKTRYFVRNLDTNEVAFTNSELTTQAAKRALDAANMKAEDLDLIVTATASPDYSIPNMACQVQELLKAKNADAIGILSGCGGFAHALTVATQFIENGFFNTALVTGSEVLSPYLDFSHPKCIEGQAINATIFGDGAGALVLKASHNDDGGVLCSYIGSDGKRNPLFLHDSGSKMRPTEETIKNGLHFWDLNLRLIVGLTPRFMKKATNMILSKSKNNLDKIDWIIPHQPTLPLVRRFAKDIDYPYEKMIIHFDNIGDTADACLPISLDMANKENKFKKGDLVLLVAAGAGWMYGANLIKW